MLIFRHLLEAHELTRRLFEEVGALLAERKLLMKEGAIVDATIIAAPSSTKNAGKERDPEMHQTKKGNQWYFGVEKHPEIAAQCPGVQWHVAAKRGKVKALAQGRVKELTQQLEKVKAQVRARVEHPFHVIKNLCKHRKVRYRGLRKNNAQLYSLFAAANLFRARRSLGVCAA